MNLLLSDVFEKFLKNFAFLAEEMRNCGHSKSLDIPSPYHMEGDVWTHTCCAYSQIRYAIEKSAHLLTRKDVIMLAVAVLFHDTGKPRSVVEAESGKLMFKGHDFKSAQIIINYSTEIRNVFKLSDDDLFKIILMVQCHTLYYQLNDVTDIYGWLNYDFTILSLYKLLTRCDALGQIRTSSLGVSKLNLSDIDFFGEKPVRQHSKRIVVAVGCPASGKDYVIDQNYNSHCDPVFSFDDIRVSEYQECNIIAEDIPYDELYRLAWEWCNKNDINLFNILRRNVIEALNGGHNTVFVSNTNLTKKSRKTLVNLAKQLHVDIECVAMFPSVNTLCERDISRVYDSKGKSVGESVIRRMFDSIVLPTYSEGFTDIKYHFNS